jgi:hypothetical protein
MKELDKAGESTRLLYPDELKHLLVKAGLEGASFPTLLTTAYYKDQQMGGTKSEKERFMVDCRLSIAGALLRMILASVSAVHQLAGYMTASPSDSVRLPTITCGDLMKACLGVSHALHLGLMTLCGMSVTSGSRME